MLVEVLEAEVVDYTAHYQQPDEDGPARIVRNAEARPRTVTLGSGTIQVRAPRLDDRREAEDCRRHRFRSLILPPYIRRSPNVAEVLPVFYLPGRFTDGEQAERRSAA